MTAPVAIITKNTHNFLIENIDPSVRFLFNDFCRPLIAWTYKMEYGRMVRMPDKVYAASSQSRSYYRFHINQFEDFLAFCKEKGVPEAAFRIVDGTRYEPVNCSLPLREGWVPKEDQVNDIKYLIESPHPGRLLTRQTGTGKTFCAMAACAELGHRIVIIVKSMYLSKWHSDVSSILNVSKDDVITVKGGEALKLLILRAKEGLLTEKVILIGITSYQKWVSLVEEDPRKAEEEGYECMPDNFFETIGAGVRVTDEVHSHFHQMYKLDLYSNVPVSISLSATLISRDPLVSRMYEVMYPLKHRTKELALNRYAVAIAVHFQFEKPQIVRVTERGGKNYSHNAVEKSIMGNPKMLKNYFTLIKRLVDLSYISHPRKKKRLAVFASTVDMCGKIVKYLKQEYRHLDIRLYCDGAPYANAIEPDIRVTTVGSCGAAIDIPDLVSVIMTHNIDSPQANVQALGRLRELKGGSPEENAVYYYYLTADNIQKHQIYDKTRRELFGPRTKKIADINAGIDV